MQKPVIGVMGPGDGATELEQRNAEALGNLIAQQGWVLLTGGRNVGVMAAANRGAKQANGLTIGVLPDRNLQQISEFVDVPIITDMGSARNNINVLSSAVIIACGLGAGTASEIALALKAQKPVVLLGHSPESQCFFKSLSSHPIFVANTPEEAITISRELLCQNPTAEP